MTKGAQIAPPNKGYHTGEQQNTRWIGARNATISGTSPVKKVIELLLRWTKPSVTQRPEDPGGSQQKESITARKMREEEVEVSS